MDPSTRAQLRAPKRKPKPKAMGQENHRVWGLGCGDVLGARWCVHTQAARTYA